VGAAGGNRVSAFLLVMLLATLSGCGVKALNLPQVSYPYTAEMEFLKEVRNVQGKVKKKKFKRGRISSPFYFLLKIKEIENDGTIAVRFYRDTAPPKTEGKDSTTPKGTGKPSRKKAKPPGTEGNVKPGGIGSGRTTVENNAQSKAGGKEKASPIKSQKDGGRLLAEKTFQYGKPGKYYEYVIFFDKVKELKPGIYRYVILHDERVLYEDGLKIEEKKK
ncbi:MAG: hypothetical protein GY765_11940, partial [bacterium]|nr:hypothetical protein [bacterium]